MTRRRAAHLGVSVCAASLALGLLLEGCRTGMPVGLDVAEAGVGEPLTEPLTEPLADVLVADPPLAAAAPERDSRGTITLAFAGDVHFEGGLVGLPTQPGSTLGPMSRDLRSADLAMVNLESALTRTGMPTMKEREVASNRHWFRSPPAALDLLARSGVDVVSVANNHGADYGLAGLRDTLRIAGSGPVAVVGVGRDQRDAFEPHRVSIRGTDVAVFAADASPRESADPIWAVGPGSGPGLASARLPFAGPLLGGVRRAADAGELVVVYLHWGAEGETCPTGGQRALARALAEAGADVVVGTHAHRLLGAGTLGSTYISYGLGNFLWYHGRQSETGVLRLRVTDGEVVSEDWRPGEIPLDGGQPRALSGTERTAALRDWAGLRGCTDLAPGPGTAAPQTPAQPSGAGLPAFTSTVRRIGPGLRERMSSSHDPATCPVPLADLRHLTLSYVGFDGRARNGEMVVNADVVADVVEVFAAMYRARFPIQRMRLVDEYGGDDDLSMAANNTSGYNCRTVAGQSTFSDHAYGRAVDINPVQNPYVLGAGVLPEAGLAYVAVDRSPGARPAPGVITEGDVVTSTFAKLGWTWGGVWSDPDFQHFSTS